ncbi:hypothetical protein FGO68_gene91 [Halteria grandinella]|uniref:Uncharacterized protein n=1 Tax=Halteria grandinella TaxID=5974 RepID=A0A8J8SXP5_HALGN|nr:hypothetical protein FGO68_gene91 [Halteria grandinella]
MSQGGNTSNQQKKSGSKQRTGGAATSQGIASQGVSFMGNNNPSISAGGFVGGQTSNSAHRGSEGIPNMSAVLMHPHNQTVKIPQQYLNNNIHKVVGIPNMTAALTAAGVQAPSSLSMSTGVVTINGSAMVNGDKNLSASQKKRISLKKLEEEYCKTIEQVGSPNSSTLNLENMKKTHSLHYMRAGSGASSPQQIKSRTSIGKYAANGQNPGAAMGMQIYNNYNNQAISNNSSAIGQLNQRNSFVSKSQIGQAMGASGVIGQQPGGNGPSQMQPGSALGTGNRSRSKTTNRKKRNLYTSMGNYYQSQQPTAANQNGQQANNSASRVTKRVHQQNFLDNLEQTNMLI